MGGVSIYITDFDEGCVKTYAIDFNDGGVKINIMLIDHWGVRTYITDFTEGGVRINIILISLRVVSGLTSY